MKTSTTNQNKTGNNTTTNSNKKDSNPLTGLLVIGLLGGGGYWGYKKYKEGT